MLKSNLQYISTKIYFYDSSKELMMFNTPSNSQLPPVTSDVQRPEISYKRKRLFLYVSFLARIFLP